MTHPTYRALCARFVDAVALLCGSGESPARGGERLILTTHVEGLEELATEARAALAAEPQQGVSDEDDLMQLLLDDHRGVIEFVCDTEEEAHVMARSHVKFARAVLARYAPTPAPVAVGERPLLRSSNFNDDKGRCWCGTKAFVDEHGDLPADYPPAWELREPCAQDDCVLPATALPLPEAQP